MDRIEQAWRRYMEDSMDEADVAQMDTEQIGEWAWAEIVAWANNSDEYYDDVTEIAEWAKNTVPEADCLITEDMVVWAMEYAIAHGLPADWSLM